MKKQLCVLLGLMALSFAANSSYGQASTILPNDDVFCESPDSVYTTTTTYDGYQAGIVGGQVVFGLGAANGTSTGRRRSYVEFTIGTEPVGSAIFKIYNYWGANMGGQGNNAGSGSLRLRATPAGTPVTIDEPSSSMVTDWVAPGDAAFTSTINTITVNAVGWWTIDVTSWYNARLGETTTLALRGAATSGFDFPLYEDREGSAYAFGSDNTIPDAGPRIDIVVPEPSSLALCLLGGIFAWLRRR
jgi:hypothetical protein